MLKYLLIGLLLLSSIPVKSQKWNGVKSITRYEDTIIRSISLLDTLGNTIFWKNNGLNGPVVMVGASYYDSLNRRIKSISAHSNVGFSVWTYEFDTAGNEIKVFAYKEPPEAMTKNAAFNPYIHIEGYTTAHELENDTAVLRILNAGDKNILFYRTFDIKGNQLEEIQFKDNGDTSTIQTNEFDQDGNCIHFHYDGNIGDWNYYYTYDKNGNKLTSKRVDNPGDTSEVYFYKYNKENDIIEEQYKYKGKTKYTEKYYYKDGLRSKKVIYNFKNKRSHETIYEYDDNGNIIKEVDINIKEKETHILYSKYEYYNLPGVSISTIENQEPLYLKKLKEKYDTLIPIFDGLYITHYRIDSIYYSSVASKYGADTIMAFYTGDFITHYTHKWGVVDSTGNIIVPFICDAVKTISKKEGIFSVYSHSFSLNTGIPRYRYFGKYYTFTKAGITNKPGVDFNIKVEYIADWHNAEFVIRQGAQFFLPEEYRIILR